MASLVCLAPSLVVLGEAAAELQAVLPPPVLELHRHLRAPTPMCARTVYSAQHVGAARWFQRAYRQAALRFEALSDAHPARRLGLSTGAAWYQARMKEIAGDVVVNSGWQPGVLRHVLLPWRAEPRRT